MGITPDSAIGALAKGEMLPILVIAILFAIGLASLFGLSSYGIDSTIWHLVILLGVLMLTSKGSAGVTGSGFLLCNYI
jgi:Na+/H+-dicarboxylate symporter